MSEYRYRLSVATETNTVTLFLTHQYEYSQDIFDLMVRSIERMPMSKRPAGEYEDTREERKLNFISSRMVAKYGFEIDNTVRANYMIRMDAK